MKKKNFLLVSMCIFLIAAFFYFSNADAQKAAPAEKPVKVDTCYECHSQIKDFHSKGKHAKVNCVNCHEGLEKHLKEGPTSKPVTRMDHATCGKCHKEQYESFVAVEFKSKPKVEKSISTSLSPLFDAIMKPHGFTREHAEPRSHVSMLVDHLLVDRAYGGRFQLKDLTKMGDAKALKSLHGRY